jgi:replicative DNA helicase
MTPNLTKRIENILRRSEDENEILISLKQLLSEQEIQPVKIKESKTISELFVENKEVIMNPNTNQKFVQTGFRTLDKMLGGFMLGEFVVIGARPAMGKSQLFVNLAINISQVTPTLFVSLDLNEFRLTSRFIATLTGVELQEIFQMTFSEEAKLLIKSSGDKFNQLNLSVNDEYGGSLLNFRALCQKHIEEQGVKVIFVDELQLMNPAFRYRNSRELEISSISKAMKDIAKDFNVCVIAGSQLNRGVEGRSGLEGKRPQLSDLRESGAIEQDADKVIFIHRPEYYHITEDAQGNSLIGIAELIIAKNKIGPVGEVMIKRNQNFSSFVDYDYQDIAEFNFSQQRMDEIKEVPF